MIERIGREICPIKTLDEKIQEFDTDLSNRVLGLVLEAKKVIYRLNGYDKLLCHSRSAEDSKEIRSWIVEARKELEELLDTIQSLYTNTRLNN